MPHYAHRAIVAWLMVNIHPCTLYSVASSSSSLKSLHCYRTCITILRDIHTACRSSTPSQNSEL